MRGTKSSRKLKELVLVLPINRNVASKTSCRETTASWCSLVVLSAAFHLAIAISHSDIAELVAEVHPRCSKIKNQYCLGTTTHNPSFKLSTLGVITHNPSFKLATLGVITHNPSFKLATPGVITHNPSFKLATLGVIKHNPSFKLATLGVITL